ITSLYRRSSATLSTLKSACTARRIPPPPSQLDDSIDSAVVDIERELKKGVRRFGSDFENGDERSITALSEVERELRTGLFVRVRFATFSENEDIHGPELVDTADWARDRVMLILLKYKNSLWQCDEACPTAQRKSSVATSRSGNSRKSIDMGNKKIQRENSLASDLSGDEETQLAKIEQSAAGHDRHDSSATVRASSPSPTLAKKMSIASNAPGQLPPTSGSMSYPSPTPENSYLGLCKNAVRLQNGEKKAALEKRKEFNDGWSQSSVYFLACASSKCAFAGHVNLDAIWTKSLTSVSRGLKFRWAFLAKSHVSQSKVHNRQYQFLCLFCLYTTGYSSTFNGTDSLLDHVSSTHKDEAFTTTLLSKTGAVVDRVCEDTDDFDINIFPVNATFDGRKNSTYSNWSTDDLRLGRTVSHQSHSSASDSVMETLEEEPWNAGLSEFHYKDDYIPD
ncbi:hypothetical protein K431DRAFT_234988, partial [Polychaeton citri CBS 116435]